MSSEIGLPQEAIDWILNRPANIQAWMCDFPPGCTVEVEPGHYGFPGLVDEYRGQVVSYFEDEGLGVVTLLTNIKVALDPEHCKVVSLAGAAATPEQVREVVESPAAEKGWVYK